MYDVSKEKIEQRDNQIIVLKSNNFRTKNYQIQKCKNNHGSKINLIFNDLT